MSQRHRLRGLRGLLGGGGGNLHSYLMSLAPTLYLRFNEATGNIVNYGSDGVNGSGTVSGCTQEQAGQLGAGEAYLYDGVDDSVSFANAAVPATKALTTQRWVFLVNASSLGEGSAGKLAVYGNGTGGINLYFSANNALFCGYDTDGTDAVVLTNNNQVDFLNTWALVFVDIDPANQLGLGARIRILRATAASATTLLTLSANIAASGTLVTPTLPLNIGNNANTTATIAGLMDFTLAGAGLWSPAASPTDLTIPNRIRSLVFHV